MSIQLLCQAKKRNLCPVMEKNVSFSGNDATKFWLFESNEQIKLK